MTTTKRSFAAVVQVGLIGLLICSFILITQNFNRSVYQWGVLLLIVSTLFQIVFSNIPPSTGFVRSLIYLVFSAILIGGIVALSISLVPFLLDLGKR
jgi:FtsH-binding integral membrane protein